MKNENNSEKHSNIAVYISLFLAILLLILDSLGSFAGIRKGISFVFEPATFQVNAVGKKVNEYFQVFVHLGEFQKDYNALKVEIYEKEALYSSYSILKNENDALKKQIALGNQETQYVMANVLREDLVDAVLIDQGSDVGVKQGDVVTVGNTFVGIVSSVDLKGGTVRLPSDANSHLEIVVLKSGQSNVTKAGILSSGVISGSPEGIKIENISMNSDVADGDTVYINDSKVGGFLALGYVVGLSSNPASTYKTAFVSPILDYDNLMQVFVRVE